MSLLTWMAKKRLDERLEAFKDSDQFTDEQKAVLVIMFGSIIMELDEGYARRSSSNHSAHGF